MDRERVTGLREIKDEKEKEAVKRELEGYIKEYTWFNDKDKSMSEIKRIIEKYMKRYEEERENLSQEQEENALRQIQLLQTRYSSIANDTFMPRLVQNITATILSLEAYEAKQKKVGIFDIIRGLAKGDEETKEYLSKKYTFEFANLTGDVPGVTNLNLMPMSEILKNISQNYGLIGINIPEEERALTVSTKMNNSQIYRIARDRCNEFLKKKGLPVSELGEMDERTETEENEADTNRAQEVKPKQLERKQGKSKNADKDKVKEEGEIEK